MESLTLACKGSARHEHVHSAVFIHVIVYVHSGVLPFLSTQMIFIVVIGSTHELSFAHSDPVVSVSVTNLRVC